VTGFYFNNCESFHNNLAGKKSEGSMKNRSGLIRKITNLLGIGFMMLGVVPVSVLSQAGSVYAAEQAKDGGC